MNDINTFSPRSAFRVQRDVVFALFVRELKTRFGPYKLGYLWALIEPTFHTTLLIMLHLIRGAGLGFPAGIDLPVCFLIGFVPFFMWRNITGHMMSAVTSNRGLFFYRQVKPMDTMIARAMLEIAVSAAVYLILLIVAGWLGHNIQIYDPLGLLAIYVLLSLFSFGFGMICCVIATLFKEGQQVINMILIPSYFISAIFYPLRSIPSDYQFLILWNPLVHFMELARTSFFLDYNTQYQSEGIAYILACTILNISLGLVLYRATRLKLVASS